MKRLKSGRWIPDPFAFEAGIMKGIRNANKRLIPTDMKIALTEKAKELKKIIYLDVEWQEVKELPKESQGKKPDSSFSFEKTKSGGEYTLSFAQRKWLYGLVGFIFKNNRTGKPDLNKGKEMLYDLLKSKYGEQVIKPKEKAGGTWNDIVFPSRDEFEILLQGLKNAKTKTDFNTLYNKEEEKEEDFENEYLEEK